MLAIAAEPPEGKRGFYVGVEWPSQVPVLPAVSEALKNLGVDFITYYPETDPSIGEMNGVEVNAGMQKLAQGASVDTVLSCHHYDPSKPVLEAFIPGRKEGHRLEEQNAVIIDELEHIRLLNSYGHKQVADTQACETLEQAYDVALEGFIALRKQYETLGIQRVVSTHVWPVLHHVVARAGFTVCPKIMKEMYSPVSIAMGLGAAKQYEQDLWIDCDLWYYEALPGHTAEKLRSNLLLAYWMGADRVYVEGAGFNLAPAGRQGFPFSLVNLMREDIYQYTAHGEVLRWFCKEYVPKNPRPYNFRDIQPHLAIVRFEDTCHGQRFAEGFADQLYGAPKLQSNADTEAWLGLWNLLTHGRTGLDGITQFKIGHRTARYERVPTDPFRISIYSTPSIAKDNPFFVPLDGVICYDHLVGYDALKNIPLIFVTGVQVSDQTLAALQKRVKEGATVVIWAPLALKKGLVSQEIKGTQVAPEGEGKWIYTDHFSSASLFKEVGTQIGSPDLIQYRFNNHTLKIKHEMNDTVTINLDGKTVSP